MAATRTQIYLTAEQRERLDALRRRRGGSLAEQVREAVDLYLASEDAELAPTLEATFGALPELEVPDRAGWGRRGIAGV